VDYTKIRGIETQRIKDIQRKLRSFYAWKNKPVEKFWAKVEILNSDSCWEWQKSRLPTGYGHIGRWGKKMNTSAHRVAWEVTYGEIPEGLHIMHLCDNPPCCNPQHLMVGTHQENMRQRSERNGKLKSIEKMASELLHGSKLSELGILIIYN